MRGESASDDEWFPIYRSFDDFVCTGRPLGKKNAGNMVDFLDMTSKMVLNVISSVPLQSLGGKF